MDLHAIRATLTSRAGGWLRNPIRREWMTCAVCTTPSPGYLLCYPCRQHSPPPGLQLADRVAPMTYALANHQSGYVMRAYKAPNAPREHREYVALLCLVGLNLHLGCPGRLAGAAVSHWSAVPSLPAKPHQHPLQVLVSRILPLPEVPLVAASAVTNPRGVSVDHFRTTSPARDLAHVLLIDDTWVSGGHAQSAALSLRVAGAAHVSILTVARWLDSSFGDNRLFIREQLTRDYDPLLCPWTGGTCPTGDP